MQVKEQVGFCRIAPEVAGGKFGLIASLRSGFIFCQGFGFDRERARMDAKSERQEDGDWGPRHDSAKLRTGWEWFSTAKLGEKAAGARKRLRGGKGRLISPVMQVKEQAGFCRIAPEMAGGRLGLIASLRSGFIFCQGFGFHRERARMDAKFERQEDGDWEPRHDSAKFRTGWEWFSTAKLGEKAAAARKRVRGGKGP